MPKTLAVHLTAQGQRHLKAGHPWIYADSIERLKGEGKSGDLAVMFDRRRDRFIGIGLYDPDSPIRIKVLHQGAATKVNEAFFALRIEDAFAKRAELLQSDTNAYRFLNGENDGFPSLIADVYADVLVIKSYSVIWAPYLDVIIDALQQHAKSKTVVLRLSRAVEKASTLPNHWKDGAVLRGSLPVPEIVFTEHGIKIKTNVLEGHKTGFFLDHRANRRAVGLLSKNRSVLDVFSYAGGFAVHALCGGATTVTCLDISKQALALARQNAVLNLENPQLNTLAGDAFFRLKELQETRATFGLIVIDPPSFAKRAKEVDGAMAAYRRLTRAGIPLVEHGGILVLASCSARVTSADFYALQLEELKRSGRRFEELKRTGHDLDHPVTFMEGAYLKTLYVKLF